MKTNSLITIMLVCLFAVSCNEDVDKGTVWDDPNFIRITVTSEPMATSTNNSGLLWAATDTLMVFDKTLTGYKLGTTDLTSKAIFYSHKWGGDSPTYAGYSSAGQEITYLSEGVFGVTLPAEQSFDAVNTYAAGGIVSIGKITGNRTAYIINPIYNISGLLKVSMKDPTAKSITIEAIGGEKMAGAVDVDYALLAAGNPAFWTPTAGKEQSSSVTITAAEGSVASTEEGCLQTGAYYISVLPQTYSQGLRVTVPYGDGTTLVRLYGEAEGFVIPRSDFGEFGKALDDTLPDVITLSLDFYNETDTNPFGVFVATADQVVAGESYTYTYSYELDGQTFTEDYTFIISKGASNATYRYVTPSGISHSVLMFGAANNAWMTIPGIPGRYLKSLSMSHGNNTAAKRFSVLENNPNNPAGVGKYFSSPKDKATSATIPYVSTVPFPTGISTGGQIDATIEGYAYTMRFTEGSNLRVFNITAVYSTTLEEPEE
jgi:hypothetical protein